MNFTRLKNSLTDARLFGAVLSFCLAERMVEGSFWILSEQSLTGKVARLATYPSFMAVAWLCLAFFVMPYLLFQIFGVFKQHEKMIKKIACRSILAGGVIWFYLAYLSRNLDYAYVTEIFLISGLTCVVMSFILANSLNNEQLLIEEIKQTAAQGEAL